MKHMIRFIGLVSCWTASSAYGQAITGYTTMDVDATSNVVTATCETDLDAYTEGDYEAIVRCSVVDANGNQIASGQYIDQNSNQGYAQVVLTFAGTPGTTYTATGSHSAELVVPVDLPDPGPHSSYYDDPYDYNSFSEGPPTPPTYSSYTWYGPGPDTQVPRRSLSLGQTTAQTTDPACPSTVTIADTTTASLPSVDLPGALTGIGILTRMLVSPLTANYAGQQITEQIIPQSNSCPANITSYTNYPNVFTSFTVGATGSFEGIPYPSVLNSYYDEHVNDVNFDVLGATSVSSCVSVATQIYRCGGQQIGTFTLSKTFTHGMLSGTPVTNVSVTKQ